jgi:hypothetical protein
MRQLDFCPVHFAVLSFNAYVDISIIRNWLYEHTDSRFYLTKTHSGITVALEDHAELTYFALQLPELNNHHYQY